MMNNKLSPQYQVLVLLSTYNGEQYLIDQLESIYSQNDVEVSVLVRDDGSTDNTIKLLTKYQRTHTNLKIIAGENIGYKRSFMNLIYACDDSYDYYAFADQDDIWVPDKLIQAISKIKKVDEKPVLYYGFMTQVDENLNVMKEQQSFKEVPNKKMILFQNFVQGSTIVFNKQLLLMVRKYNYVKETPHDIWLPILASYIGEVIGDKSSYILYRRHAASVTVGDTRKYWKNLAGRILSKEKINNYAIDLLKGYSSDISKEDQSWLREVAQYRKLSNKIKLLLDHEVKKYTAKGTVMLKLAILFNRIE